jgi:prevent-host-death family protein
MPSGRTKPFRTIAISEFKAKCLSLLEQVSKTKIPLRVTRRGEVIADVVPASPNITQQSWIGSMSGSIEITGDILSSVIETEQIEALQK